MWIYFYNQHKIVESYVKKIVIGNENCINQYEKAIKQKAIKQTAIEGKRNHDQSIKYLNAKTEH